MSQNAPKVDRVLVEVTIAAPAAEVWAAVRDPEKIRRWFGWDADTLKAEIDYIFIDHAKADEAGGVILFEGVDDRFEVESRGAETVLRVIRSAPAGDSWDEVYEDMTEGWISFVEQLRFYLERHRADERRTLYFSGAAVADQPAPTVALGLGDLRSLADGAAWGPREIVGQAMDGAVWHRSAFQIGVTAPAWGDGLLVVADRTPWAAGPHGGGWAILTTYGLDEAAFADLEARWRAWWSARYPPPTAEG